jgi:hypothetical protein
LQENAKIKLKSQKAIIGNEYQLLKDKISTIIQAKQIEKDHINNGKKQKKKKKRGSKRKKNKKQKNNSKILNKKETSQPLVNEIQNVHINQPKQLKQPKQETIRQNQPQQLKQPNLETMHQNQSKQLNQETTHQNQPQQLNQPNRETLHHNHPPFNQGTQCQQTQRNQGSWITQKIQPNQYIQPDTTQPQLQYMNTPINNYTNVYHTIEQQPNWANQQNQIQARGFQTRNEFCFNNQYVNSNYYSEHQIMDNLIRETTQYTNKNIPQIGKQEIPQFQNEYVEETEDVEETEETNSRSTALNSTCIDFDSSIIINKIYENFHNLSLESQQILTRGM